VFKGFTSTQLDGNGIKKGLTQLSLFDLLEITEVSGCKSSCKNSNQKDGLHFKFYFRF
jgi:hypothetical protein